MPRLDELPSGAVVFLDANIVIAHFLQQSQSCTFFLERLWRQDILGVTSVLVLSEVRHGLLRAEVCATRHLPAQGAVRFLREHPEVITTLTNTHHALAEFRQWPVRIVHLTRSQFWRACQISRRSGLLSNDALHVGTMRAHRIRHLASADRDFDRVPNLTRWAP